MPIFQGAITMWSGTIQDIPEGWALCDGQNETLDLRNRFIVGAGSTYAVGATGGGVNAITPSHTHSISGSTNSVAPGNHTPFITANAPGASANGVTMGSSSTIAGTTSQAGSHGHGIGMSTTGEVGTNKNLPPYYALAFIQQII